MKKPLIWLTVVVALAFVLITLAKRKTLEDSHAGAAVAEADKQQIKTFWATYQQANALRAQGDFARAVPAYREALRLNPRHEDSLYYLGTSLAELGDYSAATATFRRLLELNPASGRALGELGSTLSLLAPGAPTHFEEARQVFLRNVGVNREQAGPFLRLGTLELNQGRLEQALQDFGIAARFGSPEGNFSVGYVLFLQKRFQEAAPYFRKVLDAYGHDRKIVGRGVLSEGDVLPAPGKPLTALEKAGLKSLLFLYWAAYRMGGYPAGVPKEFQLQPAAHLARDVQSPGAKPEFEMTGGRATWVDVGKDGDARLVVAGLGQALKLYRRTGKNLVGVTDSSGLQGVTNVWDAYGVDFDADGYQDLYLVRSGPLGSGQNLLYHNNRDGTFSDVTREWGLLGARSTARACFFDFDGDGRVDLLEAGAADSNHGPLRLFRNTGNRFVEVTQQAGLAATGTAVDCAVADYNRDGKPDLFVLYWKQEASLYRNLGHGQFANATEQTGLKGIRDESFSALFFDFDKDGSPDLLVTAQAPYEEALRCLLQPGFKASRSTPRLFRNLGTGRFEEVTEHVGLTRSYGTMQALAADFDGDGWPDLLLINGSLDAQRLEPSVILRNVQGKEFREWSYLPSFTSPGNFLGGSVMPRKPGQAAKIYLVSQPLLTVHQHRSVPSSNPRFLRARR